MPAETTESVAEHSTRLHVAACNHQSTWMLQLQPLVCLAALEPNLLPRRQEGTRIYNRSSSTVYMCIAVHSTILVNLTWQNTIQLEMATASSKHSQNTVLILDSRF